MNFTWQYIIVKGNINDGFNFIGPFQTLLKAQKFINKHYLHQRCNISQIAKPKI